MSAVAEKPFQFLQDVRRQATSMACGTPFYNWLLSSGDAPSQLAVKLVDPWPGHAETGRLMCRGVLSFEGATLPFDGNVWMDVAAHPQWYDYLHEFGWLRDLRALGGDASRKLARILVDRWMDEHERWDARSWRPDLIGQRISMWLVLFDFFCGSADEDFQRRYFSSLVRQARHLSRALPGALSGVALLRAARGLIYAGLSLPGRDDWILHGFDIVLQEIPKQILADGSHVSRSPQQLLDVTQILLDLRYALNRANLPVPEAMRQAILRAGAALKFFRYADKRFGLFHGAQEGDVTLIDAIMGQIPSPGKPARSLPYSGFERVTLGRSLLVLDRGPVPVAPFDQTNHLAPLSFEFAFGKERIFTNCGGHPASAEWQQVLRHTAAHNTLVLGGRLAGTLNEDGAVGRRHSPIVCTRTENRDTCLLDASHDAYVPACGVSHRRRLYLCDQGYDLRGEETLSSRVAPAESLDVAVRFHLHPRVLASLTADGQDVKLRLPGGTGWTFYAVGAQVSLESSIYLGFGLKPLKTKQIVLSARLDGEAAQFKWALQRD